MLLRKSEATAQAELPLLMLHRARLARNTILEGARLDVFGCMHYRAHDANDRVPAADEVERDEGRPH